MLIKCVTDNTQRSKTTGFFLFLLLDLNHDFHCLIYIMI